MTEIEYGTLEFALWLLLAVAVGFAVGWMLRKWWLDRKETGRIEEIQREAAEKEGALQAELDEYRSQTESLSRDMDLRSADLDRTKVQLADRDETIAALEADAAGAKNDVAQLEAKVEDRESTIAALRADAEKESAQIAVLRSELESERRQNEGLEDRAASLSDVQAQITGLERDLEEVRRQRGELITKLDALEAEHAESSMLVPGADADTAADLPDREVAVAKVAEIAARTRGTGPTVDDDLKRIRGVGPKLEKLLKSMDITSFAQVANFTADDIQYVTAALDAFPGRIERDDWMASAATEHSRKYGGPV